MRCLGKTKSEVKLYLKMITFNVKKGIQISDNITYVYFEDFSALKTVFQILSLISSLTNPFKGILEL